ncbi:rhodanese-like domain-containing protein [Pseudorhodoferax sp. Leaf267]|uniref:rhodanese-like domain-containing protein n=1 Tax=Pseudorhodoferax sp. Leaf267 TaxID=1736316 RepID=UPI0006F244B4|nr:rhodanese-like domain-containing protein [Pseudorhodoferax sp. Leaf267]KQP22739.1 sulfurtransferase [Pseudorhodoferax sp. Leaf267]
MTPPPLPTLDFAAVRRALLAREEIALLDLREEDPFAQCHPLWAANLPLSRIELDAWRRIPRRDTTLVLYGEHDGEDLVPRGAAVLAALGYTRLFALAGGLAGWQAAGGEVFRDVNVPSKAFGELVEHMRHTPSLAAEEVQALIASGADAVVVDARRFDEYQTMSIPGATSVPGAELVLRVRALAPDPRTQVIVNCAGRTRSIIGTQSLVNAGLPNPVAALRNGTIGWLLAGQVLDHGASRRAPAAVDPQHLAAAQEAAAQLAERAGVRTIAPEALARLRAAPGRTVHAFDVRTPEEYAAGHLPGFANVPGGQLVQETDHQVPVRGAAIVLADDDGVRARMTGSWLAQMGWDVHVLAGPRAADGGETGAQPAVLPPAPDAGRLTPAQLQAALADGNTLVLDLGPGQAYVQAHIPGAWFAIRAQLRQALGALPPAARYVLTSADGALAPYAAADLRALLAARQDPAQVLVLDGGTNAWAAAGLPLEGGEARLATPRTDRYRRPYEGTDAPRAAMQAYLDWEFGLVEQLGRDGTHHFHVA